MKTTPSLGRLARILELIINLVLGLSSLAIVAGLIFSAVMLFAPKVPKGLAQNIEIETSLPARTVTNAAGEEVELNLDNVIAELVPTAAQRGLQLTVAASGVITLAFIAAVCWHMRRFLRSLRTDHPFISANIRRLRWVAGLSLATLVWQSLSKVILASEVSSAFPNLDVSVTLNLTGPSLISVLALFIIAEVFAVGVAMKQEQDLTV